MKNVDRKRKSKIPLLKYTREFSDSEIAKWLEEDKKFLKPKSVFTPKEILEGNEVEKV